MSTSRPINRVRTALRRGGSEPRSPRRRSGRGPVSWLQRRLRGSGRERGMVEAGIAAAGGLLVVGAVVGNGVAASVMDMSDGQTWLPSNDGSVVQINPATGQAEYRLIIGEDGEAMEVTQSDGFLVVTNLETGVATPIDLAGLVAGQGRQTEGETEILIGGGLMMIAELEPGFIQVVDPLSFASVGTAYRAGEDLSDLVIDRDGTVWMMTTSGTLRELDWVADSGTFSVSLERPVTGAGPQTQLVPHSSGVTVFAPDGGAVLQIGVGADYVQQVPALQGPVLAADRSPADLSPASATDAGLVVMISGRQLVQVDVGGIGCTRPLKPAVLEDRVYVPCGGQGVVLVLDAQGRQHGEPIQVPGGGDPNLVVDDGRLIVHDPDDDRIVLVQQDGSTEVSDLGGDDVPTGTADPQDPLPPVTVPTTPVTNPVQPPVQIDPPDITTPPTDGDPDDGDPDDGTTPTGDPDDDPTGGGTDGPGDGTVDGDADLAPTGVQATLQGDGSVELSWTAPEITPESYLVTSSDGAVGRTIGVGETSVRLTGLTCGTDLTLTVYAQHSGDRMAAARAEVATADCVDPPDDGDLTPSAVVAERAGDDVVVGWTPPVVAPDRYVVDGMGKSLVVDGADASVVLDDVACGTVEVTVTAVHTDAGEYSATSRAVTETCAPDPADLRPSGVTLTNTGGDDFRLTWEAPVEAPESYRISGSGVSATAAAGATQWSGAIACSATPLRLTVTAVHAGGLEGAAQSAQVAHTCPAGPDPVIGAPSGVTATLLGDGTTIRVTWSASSPGAEEYVLQPSSGGTVSVGTATSYDFTSGTAGQSYSFTVEARRTGYQAATSAASNTVAIPVPQTVPDAPGNLQATIDHQMGSTQHTVTWTAPNDGGSPITGYQLVWDGRVVDLGAGATSWSESVPCDPCQQMPTVPDFDVSVTAINAVGAGPAASTVPGMGTPPPPQPRDGDAVLTTEDSLDGNNMFRGTITYEPSSTWAGVGGTCTASVDGGPPTAIDCGTSAVVGSFSGRRNVGMYGSVTVTITWPGGTATTSASVDRAGEYYCDQNGCYQIASLDPSDPDVEIDPMPWQPPEVPNPPVVIAGIGMLIGAGTMRTLRALRQRGMTADPTDPSGQPDPSTREDTR